MNLFHILKRNYNTELAEQLFNTQILGGTINKKYQFKVSKILKECTPPKKQYPERQQVLLKVIELIGEPQTPKERFLIAKAYAWSRVQYRDQAIYYLELYLSNPLWEETYLHIRHNINNTIETEKNYHLNEMFSYLAKAYEGKYDFDKALQIYEYLISIFPEHPSAYRGKANILIKQNKLDECLLWVKSLKKLQYYKIKTYKNEIGQTIKDDFFNFTVNDLISDIEEKISKGYKYKPKKQNI